MTYVELSRQVIGACGEITHGMHHSIPDVSYRRENVTSLLVRYGAAGIISAVTGMKYPPELNKA